VDIGFETVQQRSALRSYAANLRVLEAADEMLGTLVQTKR
jgi:flagellar basal body rod protein FlgC